MDCSGGGGDGATARRQDNDDELLPEPDWMKEQRRVELLSKEEKLRDKKLIADTIRRKVELGMEAYEQDLEERRDRLRELLLREETQLIRELIQKAREAEEQRTNELMARIAELEKDKECDEKILLREKQMQLFEQTSQAIREARARAWTEDAKKANLAQIAEAEERRRRDREYEAFWHEQLLERCASEETAEARTASRRAESERRRVEVLRRQMEAKRPPIKEATQPDYGTDGASILPRGAAEDQAKTKQRRLREDLDRQLAEERQRAEELRALERMNSSHDDKGLPREEEPRRHADKEARRAEVLAFMQSMREFREAVARRESEADKCVRRLAADAEAKRREERLRIKEERIRSGRELRLAWDRQLEEKRQQQQHQQQLDQDNCEPLEKFQQEVKEKRARRHRAAIEYGRELLAQQNLWQESRAREQRVLDEYYELQRTEREREEQRLARELAFGSRLRISGFP
ncbi:trichohyalin-like [Phymastichus coffea]|uniref:trichohyalin-like n=1 Tax=Phymastichus coffea TaxID=108790 RepID=UPI00273BA8D9|nr:trichohyalin-like [Phymastichus coffea]